jgi:acyl-CoA oxidase
MEATLEELSYKAEWDTKAKEFVLQNPTLTASKWWNGTLGRTSNHAIVAAQLVLPWNSTKPTSAEEYISYGPHPFIVQLRDL